MFTSIVKAAVAAASILPLLSTVNAQASLQQAVYQGCYSTSYPLYTNDSLTYKYQTSGWCQQQCGAYAEKAAFGLTEGSDCYCGDKLPPDSALVDDSECNRPCQGYGSEMCGGTDRWSVYTSGLTSSVESASDSEASSAASSSGSSTTGKGGASQTASQATVTQAGQTVVVTASSSPSDSSDSKSGSGGASKTAIAAGVVVGVVAIAGIAGAVFFFMRYRKRRQIEDDHQRQQTINNFGKTGGTLKSEHSSADSRLDPTIMYRRQSDGSIAEEGDMSRRVLKVTNPDRNTMMA